MTQSEVRLRPVVTLTAEARSVVRDAIAGEPDLEHLALWLEVKGVHDGEFIYDLYFRGAADAEDGAVSVDDGELTVIVPGGSVARLQGARLEWSDDGDAGLVLVNPNDPTPPGSAPVVSPELSACGLDGPLAARAILVLEQSVNPAIASHGGHADLVTMDEEARVAYLRLSGGCQGCAMSRMSLTQGIETALKDEIPELTGIVDVTDHGGGENPFF
jgi:Fe/S biogenesis protein NfuA